MKATFGVPNRFRRWSLFGAVLIFLIAGSVTGALAQYVPGGSLDPTTIPKYVTPLVIPPVMKNSGTANDYDIAVRQFKQQILPSGFPPTTVWSYGPAADTPPATAPVPAITSQFNYPAFTIEATNGPDNMSGTPLTVDWINDLKDADGNFLPHILPIDRSLHWANPEQLPCMDATKTKDCRVSPEQIVLDGGDPTILQQPYDGPVPIITHVHGAHVGPESDGYPEAWYLPNANNIPEGYATQGTLVNQYSTPTNNAPGVASFSYPNDQPSTTLWYHDHTLGMTRNNVYAGPAGFWLIRQNDGGEDGLIAGTLPGPAPVAGDDPNFDAETRAGIREIPIVIQGRSFNLVDADGNLTENPENAVEAKLFYPANRAFFEGLEPEQLQIPFIGDPDDPSDIAPIWNPEAFFNVMVVNGVSWPELEVAPAIYRFRLLNGNNSRFLNLSMYKMHPKKPDTFAGVVPFYQIGAEQSLLPQVVRIARGEATPLPGDGTLPPKVKTNQQQALLMGLAERADVLVDFRGRKDGDIIRMFNTAPDAPFGGFPDVPADPDTTGQVMQFRVNTALLGASPTDPGGATPATDPWNLVLSLPDPADPANGPVIPGARDLALLEEESALVCVEINATTGFITQDLNAIVDPVVPGQCLVNDGSGTVAMSVPFAPKAAVLGVNGSTAAPTVTLWSDPIETNPGLNATETWELWNHTVDGHPIHLHLVKFKVVNREPFIPDPVTGIPVLQGPVLPAATEAGWKDTVIAYPGEVTRVNATFDIPGLYVWHCHIVEHEDNEMMVPYVVGTPVTDFGDPNGTIGGLF